MTDHVRAGTAAGAGADLAAPGAGFARSHRSDRARAHWLLGAAAAAARRARLRPCRGAGSAAASATSAADLGGMDAADRGRQGGRRAQRHRAAAGLGELRQDDRDLRAEVRHRGQQRPAGREQPGRDQRREPAARPGRARPTCSTSAATSRCATPTCSRPTRWRPGPTSRTRSRTRTASGSATTAATCRSATTPTACRRVTSVSDLLKPEYRGKVALNGNPTQASAGFNGVMMAALANGGSADDIAPGVEFFRQLKEAGNFLPVDPTPATIASGQTPVVIDWEYLNVAQTAALEGQRDWKLVVPEGAVGRRLLRPGDQQGRPAPGGRAALAGVPVLRRGPEHLAAGLRPAGPPGRHDRGRHGRQGGRGEPAGGQGHARVPDPGAAREAAAVSARELGAGGRVTPQRVATERSARTTATLADAAAPRGGIGRGLRRWLDYLGLLPFAVFVALFLLWPTVLVVLGAFQDPDGGLTLANLAQAVAGHLSADLRDLDRPVGDHGRARRGLRRAAGLGDLGRAPGRPAAPAGARRLGHARPVRRRHARLRLPRHLRLQRPGHAVPARPARRRHLRLGRLDLRAARPRAGLHLLPDPADGDRLPAGARRPAAAVARGLREPGRQRAGPTGATSASRSSGRPSSAPRCCCSPTPSRPTPRPRR